MAQRRPLAIIALLMLVTLGAAAAGLLVGTRNRVGETLTYIAATPQPPLPAALASPGACLLYTSDAADE